jgi:hypothetical protein
MSTAMRVLSLLVLFTLVTNTALGVPTLPTSLHEGHEHSLAVTLVGSEAIQSDSRSDGDSGLHRCDHTCHLAQHFLGHPVATQTAAAPASHDRPAPPGRIAARSTVPDAPKRPPRLSPLA